jgi:hypothetical protein
MFTLAYCAGNAYILHSWRRRFGGFGFNYILSGICGGKYSKYIFSLLPINMCSFTTRRAYNFSNINSARAFCQKHRSVYFEIVIHLLN